MLRTVRSHGLTLSADHLYDLTLLATGDVSAAELAFKDRRREEWKQEGNGK